MHGHCIRLHIIPMEKSYGTARNDAGESVGAAQRRRTEVNPFGLGDEVDSSALLAHDTHVDRHIVDIIASKYEADVKIRMSYLAMELGISDSGLLLVSRRSCVRLYQRCCTRRGAAPAVAVWPLSLGSMQRSAH